jgi:Zn-dependent M28 family amino/carboxypeptidase
MQTLKLIDQFPPLSKTQLNLRNVLQHDVETLADDIGERNLYQYKSLCDTVDFLETSFERAGYKTGRQEYKIGNKTCSNLEVEIPGAQRPEEIVVIGGHYDTVIDCPGANDNGTGVAATLALARAFANKNPVRTLRFVAFVNEEPPYFQTPEMGSYVYAKRCRERGENIVAMLSLETIGCYTDAPKSQQYPFPLAAFFPPVGNFIAFVANRKSRRLLQTVTKSFKKHTDFPFVDAALPGAIAGVGWSDQWAFWEHGYPAMMATDTAPFRYPYYHTPEDTPDKIHFEHFTRLAWGLEGVVDELSMGNYRS